MDVGMAVRTSYVFRRPRAHSVNVAGSYAAVALVAERVDGRHVQQAGVLRTVGGVASQTALGLDRDVLKDERPARLSVALGADRVLVGRGLQVFGSEGAVHIVAVAAHHQAFIHFVVEGHAEGRLGVGVALEAERRLRNLEQVIFFLALMKAVATDAADLRLGVRRALKVWVRRRVTGQAHGVHLFGRVLRGIKYFAHVPAAGHMGGTGTVAAFATLRGRTAFGVQCGFPMRRLLPSVVDLFVTSLAGLCSHILGGISGGRTGGWCSRGLGALLRGWRSGLAGSQGQPRDSK